MRVGTPVFTGATGDRLTVGPPFLILALAPHLAVTYCFNMTKP